MKHVANHGTSSSWSTCRIALDALIGPVYDIGLFHDLESHDVSLTQQKSSHVPKEPAAWYRQLSDQDELACEDSTLRALRPDECHRAILAPFTREVRLDLRVQEEPKPLTPVDASFPSFLEGIVVPLAVAVDPEEQNVAYTTKHNTASALVNESAIFSELISNVLPSLLKTPSGGPRQRKILITAHEPKLISLASEALARRAIRSVTFDAEDPEEWTCARLYRFANSENDRIALASMDDLESLLAAGLEEENGLGVCSAVILLDRPAEPGSDLKDLENTIRSIGIANSRRLELAGLDPVPFKLIRLKVSWRDTAYSHFKPLDLPEIKAALRSRKSRVTDNVSQYIETNLGTFLNRNANRSTFSVSNQGSSPLGGESSALVEGVLETSRAFAVEIVSNDPIPYHTLGKLSGVKNRPLISFVGDETKDDCSESVSSEAQNIMPGRVQFRNEDYLFGLTDDDDDEDDESTDDDDDEMDVTDEDATKVSQPSLPPPESGKTVERPVASTPSGVAQAEIEVSSAPEATELKTISDTSPRTRQESTEGSVCYTRLDLDDGGIGTIQGYAKHFSAIGELIIVDRPTLPTEFRALGRGSSKRLGLNQDWSNREKDKQQDELEAINKWLLEANAEEPLFYDSGPTESKKSTFRQLLSEMDENPANIGRSFHVYGPPVAGDSFDTGQLSMPPGLGIYGASQNTALPQQTKYVINYRKNKLVEVDTFALENFMQPSAHFVSNNTNAAPGAGVQVQADPKRGSKSGSGASNDNYNAKARTAEEKKPNASAPEDSSKISRSSPIGESSSREVDWRVQVPKLRKSQKKERSALMGLHWTPWEDSAILRAVEVFGPNWDLVACLLSSPFGLARSTIQVFERYQKVRTENKSAAVSPWVAGQNLQVKDIANWASPPLHLTDLLLRCAEDEDPAIDEHTDHGNATKTADATRKRGSLSHHLSLPKPTDGERHGAMSMFSVILSTSRSAGALPLPELDPLTPGLPVVHPSQKMASGLRNQTGASPALLMTEVLASEPRSSTAQPINRTGSMVASSAKVSAAQGATPTYPRHGSTVHAQTQQQQHQEVSHRGHQAVNAGPVGSHVAPGHYPVNSQSGNYYNQAGTSPNPQHPYPEQYPPSFPNSAPQSGQGAQSYNTNIPPQGQFAVQRSPRHNQPQGPAIMNRQSSQPAMQGPNMVGRNSMAMGGNIRGHIGQQPSGQPGAPAPHQGSYSGNMAPYSGPGPGHAQAPQYAQSVRKGSHGATQGPVQHYTQPPLVSPSHAQQVSGQPPMHPQHQHPQPHYRQQPMMQQQQQQQQQHMSQQQQQHHPQSNSQSQPFP